MSFGSRIPAVAASLTSLAIALGIAGSTKALSLADLVAPGANFRAGNATSYSDFIVKIRGRGLSHDLRDYEVVATAEGFLLMGDLCPTRRGGRIDLRYQVTGPDLIRAGVAIDAGQGSQCKLAVSEKLFAVDRIDAMRAGTRKGKTFDSATFESLGSLRVKEAITIKGDHFLAGGGASVAHSFQGNRPTPEPTTVLMLAAGLAGLTAARRNRWL